MKATLTIFIFLFYLTGYSQSVFFETNWGGSNNDFARSVRQLSDGSIYVFGFSSSGTNGGVDYALNKLDRYGNLKWTKYYGGSLDDNGLSMNVTSDGNFIVTGESYTSLTDFDILTYKIDTAGAVLWSKRYGTTANESARSVIQTSDGGYALCGFRNDPSGFNDSYIVKTNSIGDTLWTKMVGGVDNEYASSIRETPGGKLFVSADTKSFGKGGYDVELFTLNSLNGTVLWDSAYGDTFNNGSQGTAMAADGNILTWGETEISQFSPFDFFIQKTDTLGHLIWRKVFGGVNADAAFSLTELGSGELILTGYSNSYNTGPLDIVVFKTDSSGSLKWIQNYGDVGIDIGYEIIPSIYNGFLICGQTYRGTDDFYLLHVDSTGLMLDVPQPQNANHNQINVYPNPCHGSVTLTSEDGSSLKNISYSLSDNLGQVIEEGIVEVDRPGIHFLVPSGVYFLKLRAGERTEIKKIAISR